MLNFLVAAALFLFLRIFLPILMIAVGWDLFVVPAFGLAPMDFLQAAGAFVLALGVKWAMGSE